MITKVDCFEGYYNISQNCYDQRDLEAFIETFEPEYLCKLLGKDLSEQLISELEANGGVLPPASRFQILFAPMCIGCSDTSCCCQQKSSDTGYSIGLKNILTGLLYYEYLIMQRHQNTVTGVVNPQNETSTSPSNLTIIRLAEHRWNRSVTSIRALQNYLNRNLVTFPEFKGYCTFNYKYYQLF